MRGMGDLLRLTVYCRITEEVKSGAMRYPESLTYILLRSTTEPDNQT